MGLCEEKLCFESAKEGYERINDLYRECFGSNNLVTVMSLRDKMECIAQFLGIAVDVPIDVAAEVKSPPPVPTPELETTPPVESPVEPPTEPPTKKIKVDPKKNGLFNLGFTVTNKDGITIAPPPPCQEIITFTCPHCFQHFPSTQGRSSHARTKHRNMKDAVLGRRLDEFFAVFNISKLLEGLMIDDGDNDGNDNDSSAGATSGGVEGLATIGLKKDARCKNRGATTRKSYSYMFKAKIFFLIEELWKDPIAQAHSISEIVTERTGVAESLQFKWCKLKEKILSEADDATTKALRKMKRLRVSSGYFPLAERRVYKQFQKRRASKLKVNAVFQFVKFMLYLLIDFNFFPH